MTTIDFGLPLQVFGGLPDSFHATKQKLAQGAISSHFALFPAMHESPVAIRRYRVSDLPELRRITVESFGGVSLDMALEQKLGCWNERDWKARKADHIDEDVTLHPEGCFVAEREGEILGYITVRLDPVNGRGRIPNLAVVEAARGLGLGRRLIVHALEHMREAGMKVAQIETLASNTIGQHLYPLCGFEEVARQVHFAMKL